MEEAENNDGVFVVFILISGDFCGYLMDSGLPCSLGFFVLEGNQSLLLVFGLISDFSFEIFTFLLVLILVADLSSFDLRSVFLVFEVYHLLSFFLTWSHWRNFAVLVVLIGVKTWIGAVLMEIYDSCFSFFVIMEIPII